MLQNRVLCFLIACLSVLTIGYSKENKKIIICGVCKNIERRIDVTTSSIDKLKEQFEDYRVVIYENNSKDNTKELLKKWAANDPKVLIISEYVSPRKLRSQTKTHTNTRTEKIARARNIVLDEIMKSKYDGFDYVVMADLDMKPWDIEGIVDSINCTKYDWDVVCANGSYDRYAFRNEEYPLGAELLGAKYWEQPLDFDLHLSQDGEWKKVYSAFGGLAIYKREAMRGCRYDGVVTKELESLMEKWIEEGLKKNVYLAKEYLKLKETLPMVDVNDDYLKNREKYPELIGMRLKKNGGHIVWFGSEQKTGLPVTCEHVTFHAMMILKGRDKIYVNPNLKSAQEWGVR